MNKFETVLLVSPELSTPNKKKLNDEFIKLISDNSGKIINFEDWGLRDLSYKIGNFSKAFYSFYQIEIDGEKIQNLKKILIQNEDCIRHVFIRVEEHQELPTKLSNEKK